MLKDKIKKKTKKLKWKKIKKTFTVRINIKNFNKLQ
jgi:hypothetical protein